MNQMPDALRKSSTIPYLPDSIRWQTWIAEHAYIFEMSCA